ncbi:MAG: SRPBCC domain-containing protein, partial [Opitutae bacterium]|nr:SRPBCC domain-containing protein [Opitutae bacterium]
MPDPSNPAPDASDREIVISRVIHAPRELVWQAWTNPEHVVNWWGPRGFTDTTKRHEFRVGGHWEHTMHGPDGTDYPNKAKFLEIVPLERITFLLGGGSDLEADERRGVTFRATWTFEIVDADRTRLSGRMVFPSKEARDRVVRDFGAIEGGRQTLERASEYLAGMRCEPFIVSRDFDAPLDLVWRAWTDPVDFARWWGPQGVKAH